MSRKIHKTYSFNQSTLEQLELLMTKNNCSNSSEYISQLIEAECVRQEIVIEKEELHDSVSNKAARSEVMRELAQIKLQLSSINFKLKDNNVMTYQIRDAQNTQLNFIQGKTDGATTFYESETETAQPNDCLVQSAVNYENKMRRLSVEKANKGV